jgi:hypothetical protein
VARAGRRRCQGSSRFNLDSVSRGSHCIERERRHPFARPKLSGVLSRPATLQTRVNKAKGFVTDVADKANHSLTVISTHEWILSSIDQGRRCSRVHFMEGVGCAALYEALQHLNVACNEAGESSLCARDNLILSPQRLGGEILEQRVPPRGPRFTPSNFDLQNSDRR